MCNALPKRHPCGHQSVTYHYCPNASVDMYSGQESSCNQVFWGNSNDVKTKCRLANCYYIAGATWRCCQCMGGPNRKVWCDRRLDAPRWGTNPKSDAQQNTECAHGWCEHCTVLTRPEVHDSKKKRSGGGGGKKGGSKGGSGGGGSSSKTVKA